MQELKGKCECGKDLHLVRVEGPDLFILGLIIGLLMFFPLGCTFGAGKAKEAAIMQMEGE